MKRVPNYFFVLICFLGACTRETNSTAQLQAGDSAKIDESQIVLTRFPSGFKMINDSIAGLVTNAHHISLYNIASGKNTLNFGTERINFDSLITETWRKKFAGLRTYTYDPSTAGGLSDGNSQVLAFDHENDQYYIYVATSVEVNYDNDQEKIKEYERMPEIQAIKAKTGAFNLTAQETLEFIFITDNEFHLKKILTLYPDEKMLAANYFWTLQFGFVVDGNSLYVPLLNNDILVGKTLNNNFLLAKLDLTEKDPPELIANTAKLGIRATTFNDFQNATNSFFKSRSGLLYSTGKDIINVGKMKVVFGRDSLEDNEHIGNFAEMESGELLLNTYHHYKRENQKKADMSYSADSVDKIQFKFYNTLDKVIRSGGTFSKEKSSYAIPGGIVSLWKGKDNYYFGRNEYGKN